MQNGINIFVRVEQSILTKSKIISKYLINKIVLVLICSRHVGKNGNFLLASLGLICYVLIKNNEGFCKVLNTFFKKKKQKKTVASTFNLLRL